MLPYYLLGVGAVGSLVRLPSDSLGRPGKQTFTEIRHSRQSTRSWQSRPSAMPVNLYLLEESLHLGDIATLKSKRSCVEIVGSSLPLMIPAMHA